MCSEKPLHNSKSSSKNHKDGDVKGVKQLNHCKWLWIWIGNMLCLNQHFDLKHESTNQQKCKGKSDSIIFNTQQWYHLIGKLHLNRRVKSNRSRESSNRTRGRTMKNVSTNETTIGLKCLLTYTDSSPSPGPLLRVYNGIQLGSFNYSCHSRCFLRSSSIYLSVWQCFFSLLIAYTSISICFL